MNAPVFDLLRVDFMATLDRPRRLVVTGRTLSDFKSKIGCEFWHVQANGGDQWGAVVTLFEILTAAAGEPMSRADIERHLTENSVLELRDAFGAFRREM